jgi:hypothetical protein
MIIYKITNKINNKVYIGKTERTSIIYRWKTHLKNVKHKVNRHLYDSMNHYGVDNFKIEEIEKCNSINELNDREKHWIKFYNSTNRNFGYNMTYGGDGGNTWELNPNKEITSMRLSNSLTGLKRAERKFTICQYCKKKFEVAKSRFKRKYCSRECSTKALAINRVGKKFTKTQKSNISNATKGRYTLQWFINRFGKVIGTIKYETKCKNIGIRNKKLKLFVGEKNPNYKNYIIKDFNKLLKFIKQGKNYKFICNYSKVSKSFILNEFKKKFHMTIDEYRKINNLHLIKKKRGPLSLEIRNKISTGTKNGMKLAKERRLNK